jgi:hypothetical protein
MKVSTILILFMVLAVLMAISQIQLLNTWPVVRPRLNATWPMYPGAKEGFVGNMGLVSAQGITTPELKTWLPSPESVTRSSDGGAAESYSILDSAGKYDAGIGKPFQSYDLLPGGKPEPRVARGPTAEGCYNVDWSRTLELGGSYRQMTNNYQHKYPDSCSAPNHDLVLDFYKETPMGPPGE